MIQAINATNNKINQSSTNNKAKDNQVAFGFREYVTTTSNFAHYSKRIYELRKERWFFKTFPNFNPEPKIIEKGPRGFAFNKELAGEDKIGQRDKADMVESLKSTYKRLIRKTDYNKLTVFEKFVKENPLSF